MPDREKVVGHFNDCMEASRRDNTWVFVRKDIVEDALALLKEQPDVVRCKDCYFGEHTINGAGERCVQCTNSDLGMMGDCHMPNWFCADGDRR